jgi:hypothetical protein
MIDFPLVAADQIMGFNSGAVSKDTPCRRPAPEEYCPVAEMQFFGRDGQFLGIFFSYGHNTVLPEAASVAAHLNNVLAQGAVVLKRNLGQHVVLGLLDQNQPSLRNCAPIQADSRNHPYHFCVPPPEHTFRRGSHAG